MATYKVIQDIEAEDKILGPLSLRQFIYAIVSVFCLYICFLCLTKGAAFLVIVFLPPALFTGFFAFPFGGDQPTEIWALAKLRFLFKPRRRIWDQSGVKELVTINVPKKIEKHLTNGLSEVEVNSRLKALATTIDSRGWAIKNVNLNLYSQPNLLESEPDSDRLININNLPQEVPTYDVQASDDILDETSNPIAQQFEELIDASTKAHHQHIVDEMNSARQQSTPAAAVPQDQGWFMPQAPSASPDDIATQLNNTGAAALDVIAPGSSATSSPSIVTADEAILAAKLKAQARSNSQSVSYSHLRTLQPLGSKPPLAVPSPVNIPEPPQPTSLSPSDTAILSLASNNDLNVSTLAREASKNKRAGDIDGEVVISLR